MDLETELRLQGPKEQSVQGLDGVDQELLQVCRALEVILVPFNIAFSLEHGHFQDVEALD